MSSRHVVTAAHCTADITAEELSVGLGFTNFYNDEREHQTFVIHVAEIINHPGYRFTTLILRYHLKNNILEFKENDLINCNIF